MFPENTIRIIKYSEVLQTRAFSIIVLFQWHHTKNRGYGYCSRMGSMIYVCVVVFSMALHALLTSPNSSPSSYPSINNSHSVDSVMLVLLHPQDSQCTYSVPFLMKFLLPGWLSPFPCPLHLDNSQFSLRTQVVLIPPEILPLPLYLLSSIETLVVFVCISYKVGVKCVRMTSLTQ